VGEPVRERPVVRQEQSAGRLHVQAADRDDPLRQVDEVDDRRPSLRVAGRRDRPRGLVQEDVGELLRGDRLPVHLDAVAPLDERVQLPRLAVDPDAARLDQLVRLAARGYACPGEICIQAHVSYIRPMAHYVTLMRWTTQGYAGLPKWRERVEEGEQVIAAAGGTLVGVYVTLGRYDVVEIFEAPDDDVAIEILMKLNRYGAEHTETLRAFTREEAEEIVRKL
jgi:uncharacterized protein with GYD domain